MTYGGILLYMDRSFQLSAWKALALFILIVFAVATCAKSSSEGVTREFTLLRQPFRITLAGAHAQNLIDGLQGYLQKHAAILCYEDENSQISRLNRAAGAGSVKVDPALFSLLQKSLGFASVSEGLYDPTAAPLFELWKHSADTGEIPSRIDVYRVLQKVDYKLVRLFPDVHKLYLPQEGMQVNLSEISDGFLMDQAVKYLLQYDFLEAKLSFGDVIRHISHEENEDAVSSFHLPITDPSRGRILELQDLENKALALIYPDKRLIIDTVSGYPVRSDLYAVAVIGPDALSADALAYVVSMLSIKDGIQLIEDMPFFKSVCVTKGAEIWMTEDARSCVSEISPDYTVKISSGLE